MGAPPEANEPCRCKDTWTSVKDNCTAEESGCPVVACDDDSKGSWCIVANPGCAQEENRDEWAYCTPGTNESIAHHGVALSAARGLAFVPLASASAVAAAFFA